MEYIPVVRVLWYNDKCMDRIVPKKKSKLTAVPYTLRARSWFSKETTIANKKEGRGVGGGGGGKACRRSAERAEKRVSAREKSSTSKCPCFGVFFDKGITAGALFFRVAMSKRSRDKVRPLPRGRENLCRTHWQPCEEQGPRIRNPLHLLRSSFRAACAFLFHLILKAQRMVHALYCYLLSTGRMQPRHRAPHPRRLRPRRITRGVQ